MPNIPYSFLSVIVTCVIFMSQQVIVDVGFKLPGKLKLIVNLLQSLKRFYDRFTEHFWTRLNFMSFSITAASAWGLSNDGRLLDHCSISIRKLDLGKE